MNINNNSSLTSSKKKLLKIMNDPSETLLQPEVTDIYKQQQLRNKCPYLNIEVVEGTLHGNEKNSYVRWTIRVTFLDESVHYCYKRYSEFVSLRNKILMKLSNEMKPLYDIPELPKPLPWYKSLTIHDYLIHNTLDSKFLANRQQGLEYFLCYIMLDEKLCTSFDETVLKPWLNIKTHQVVIES
ncbi:PX domain-containing protein HuYPT35 [Hanseniaspora uvarum DSM 2768]|nr:PX domain-containing protein HuYPT35 [Hanseniaspora uvarum DSM 2768]GMM41536.1 hypothetical protein DAHU10_024460 [Hanseniaspora uvarum]